MHTGFLVTPSPWINAALIGGLLIVFVVIVLLALGAGVLAVFAAFHKQEPPDGRRYKCPKEYVDLNWYQLYEVQPPKPATPPAQRRPTVQELARELGLRGFGVLLLTHLPPSEVAAALIFIGLLCLLGIWIAVKVHRDSRPRQQTFDEHLDELRRESGRRPGWLSRFFRNR